eukprot:7080132-Prymnesium_polylepis.1
MLKIGTRPELSVTRAQTESVRGALCTGASKEVCTHREGGGGVCARHGGSAVGMRHGVPARCPRSVRRGPGGWCHCKYNR